MFQSTPMNTTTKAKLSRTTKSNPISNLSINYKDSLLNTKITRDKERQMKVIKKTLSEKLSNLIVYKSRNVVKRNKHN